MGLSDGSAVKGAYQVLRDPVMSGWTEITQPFASYIENISGAVDSFLQPVQQFAQETIGALKEQITKLTSEALGNASATGAAGVPAGAPESMTEQILGQQGLIHAKHRYDCLHSLCSVDGHDPNDLEVRGKGVHHEC